MSEKKFPTFSELVDFAKLFDIPGDPYENSARLRFLKAIYENMVYHMTKSDEEWVQHLKDLHQEYIASGKGQHHSANNIIGKELQFYALCSALPIGPSELRQGTTIKYPTVGGSGLRAIEIDSLLVGVDADCLNIWDARPEPKPKPKNKPWYTSFGSKGKKPPRY